MDLEAGNALAKSGKLGEITKSIVEELKPEAAYFCADKGKRTALLIVDMTDAAQIPAIAEPFFLVYNAEIEIQPVMTLEDLGRAGGAIEKAVKKYT
jgi:hypothetical protein